MSTRSTESKSSTASLQPIYDVVARIPRGRVSTYGRIAALARMPRRARLVGRALRTLPPGSDVPWHRVLNAAGQISARGDALGHEDLQSHLLRREGVQLSGNRISLERYLWQPSAPGRPPKPAQRGGGAARKAAR